MGSFHAAMSSLSVHLNTISIAEILPFLHTAKWQQSWQRKYLRSWSIIFSQQTPKQIAPTSSHATVKLAPHRRTQSVEYTILSDGEATARNAVPIPPPIRNHNALRQLSVESKARIWLLENLPRVKYYRLNHISPACTNWRSTKCVWSQYERRVASKLSGRVVF